MANLEVGAQAPAFTACDDNGRTVTKDSLKGQKVILYFYPKDKTPGCTLEAQNFQRHIGDFQKLGYAVYGISRDDSNSHQDFKAKEQLEFALLSDPQGQMCRDFGVLQTEDPSEKIARSTFVMDQQGVLTHIYHGVKPATHIQEILKDLQA